MGLPLLLSRRRAASIVLPMWLAACATPVTDGPPSRPPADIARTPDASPRVEAIRFDGPNRPYAAGGRTYVPLTTDLPMAETGLASWYGRKFHGRPTSSGETYDMLAMTAAHRTMPIPSYARVRNPANGREIVVRVNDRGPFADGRIIDLSYAAAAKLGVLAAVARVEVRRITNAELLSGRPPVTAAATDGPASDRDATVGFWLQLAALRDPAAVAELRRWLLADAGAPGVRLEEAGNLTRVQVGPYRTRDDALAAHRGLAARLGQPVDAEPLIVERR